MATSKLQIWNMALGYLKNQNSVEDENENSLAAKQCRIYYETVIGRVLRGHLWGFAKKRQTLALVGIAPAGWAFQYGYPTDCILTGHLYNPLDPQDAMLDRIDFEVAKNPDISGKVILTNQDEAVLIYGVNVVDTTLWTPDFDYAAALLLGHNLALSLANNRQRSSDLRGLYFEVINEAQKSNTREGTKNVDHAATWTEDRL